MKEKPDWAKLSKIQPPENMGGSYKGAWLEGEMAGYSRCMVDMVHPLESQMRAVERFRLEDAIGAIDEANELRSRIAELESRLRAANEFLEREGNGIRF